MNCAGTPEPREILVFGKPWCAVNDPKPVFSVGAPESHVLEHIYRDWFYASLVSGETCRTLSLNILNYRQFDKSSKWYVIWGLPNSRLLIQMPIGWSCGSKRREVVISQVCQGGSRQLDACRKIWPEKSGRNLIDYGTHHFSGRKTCACWKISNLVK